MGPLGQEWRQFVLLAPAQVGLEVLLVGPQVSPRYRARKENKARRATSSVITSRGMS